MPTIGLNIAGGEFGGYSGVHNYQYHYPSFNDLKFYADKGVDLIRVPFRWERVQDALGGALDLSGDLALIKQVLVDAAALGMDVILDCHNYGRFKGVAIGASGGPTAAQFADFWQKMATELKGYPALAGYDLMNEPHDMPTSTIWKEAAQAATDAIRVVDMDNIIYVEGNAWSGAQSWLKYNSDLIINDPANKIVYQAHVYFDDNSSGTYDESYEGEAADPMVGVRRLTPFVEWLEANNLKGMIGEFGVPSTDPRWLEVQKNALDYMQAHNLDGTAWGGGTWWGTSYSMYTARPNQLDSAYMNLLEQYFGEYQDVFASVASPSSPTLAPPPPVIAPTIAINDMTVNETDSTIVFTISRVGDLSRTSSVNFATSNGSASSGWDYTAVSGSVTFAVDQATATVSVRVADDTSVETPETLNLNLSGGINVIMGDHQGVGTIHSDDIVAPLLATTTIMGSKVADYLKGDDAGNIINGLAGSDTIDGGLGDDVLTGGSGKDRFVFTSIVAADGDTITDFARYDKVDLRLIDANIFLDGDQSFQFLNDRAFFHQAGQLREYTKDGKYYIEGDVDGDAVADFTIQVIGRNLSTADFYG